MNSSSEDPHKQYIQSFLNRQNKGSTELLNKNITYMDVFCGGGGLSLGLEEALEHLRIRAKMLVAIDSDVNALKLTAHHFNPFVKSSSKAEKLIKYAIDPTGELKDFISKPKVVDNNISQFKNQIDLLVGGPPCQGHSNLNNHTRNLDARNKLYYVMPAFAIALNIPCIIIENVKQIVNSKENVVEITKGILKTHGYNVKEEIITATDYGVAQTRKRHFLIASKIKEPITEHMLSSLKEEPLSFNDINSDKPLIHDNPKILENAADLSEENQKRIKFLHKNDAYNLPNEIRPKCHQDGHTYRAVYGRMHGDKPAPTITTGFRSPGRGRYIHPSEPRTINIREAARIQSFPDWYFKDIDSLGLTKTHLDKIIGDAVPSMMVFPLILSLYESIESLSEKSI